MQVHEDSLSFRCSHESIMKSRGSKLREERLKKLAIVGDCALGLAGLLFDALIATTLGWLLESHRKKS